MSKSGFNCPYCNSWDTEYLWGSTTIECNTCGRQFDPGEEDETSEYVCPRCECDDLDIDDDGYFVCNGCGLEGDIEDLE